MTVAASYVLLSELPGQAREVLRLTGADAQRFLQGMVSNDVSELREGQTISAALLTTKGQLVSELIVLPMAAPTIGLLVPTDCADEVVAGLDKYIIMDDVHVERHADVMVAFTWPAGPGRARGGDGITTYETRHPAPGDLLLGDENALRARLAEFSQADGDTFERYRIETGSPAWGRELRPGRLPPEMGFVYAVSYDKGCYLGQEPLARVHARGRVNRVMVRVRADAAPQGPLPLASSERAKAGEWTSWAPAPDGGVVGLALVHRSVAEPGTKLQTEAGDSVEVTSKPLGDDPGMRASA